MSRLPRRKQILGVLFVAALAGLASACGEKPAEVEALERAADEPRAATGREITAEGRVRRVFGDCAYELEDADPLARDRLLTLCVPVGPNQTPPESPADVAEGDWLRVTGVAGEITRQDYEFKTTLTLPEDVFAEEATRPVIFVEKAEKVPAPSGETGEAGLPVR